MRLAWRAALTSAGLSALFLIVYGSCNWLTGLRSGVGSCYFAWERHIPFVPAFIVPYLSIDLFFIAAPLLARSPRELRMLAMRIATAILVAGACFLLLPLQFAFARPAAEGWIGAAFDAFRALDQPFNQCPSLHVALCIMLAQWYHRHLGRWPRLLSAVWFGLIALSPVLTYQHHVVDIVGGAALAVVCVHLLADEPLRQHSHRNLRVAAYYAAGGAVLSLFAFAWPVWSWPLLWPAGSLVLVAAGYAFLGAGVYRKRQGALPWTTWLLLGPVLVGHRLSLMYYARRCRPYDQLAEGVWIGRRLSEAQAVAARAAGVTAVLDLAAESSEPRAFRSLAYRQIPILDLTAPTAAQVAEAVAFIEAHVSGRVYVHCKIGYSRTAAVAGAWLLATGLAATAEEAVAALQRARPSIVVRPEAMATLRAVRLEVNSVLAIMPHYDFTHHD